MKQFAFITDNPGFRKYRFEILSAIVLAVILGLVLYIIQPLASSCMDNVSDLFGRKEAIAEAQNFEKNLKRVIGQNNELKAKAAGLKMNMSNGRTLSNIYAMVNTASSSSGITVVTTNALPEEEGGNYIRLRFDIEVKGPYNAVGGFLESMEKSGYIVSVDELVMDNTFGPELSGKLRISLYLYK
ncbi:MAG: hypothetical protein A2268_04260 [Candidatus Raymondbacteria bacterium RifOxyA12_full_50_37]|uniref:Type 4a pilus biogenesis protein PilO n=1 Tax=Candidatus Raymondbacteria bacterium RIFOXYD12_FULL_49_13 TaxID=1817890 RepID=A0A1F7FBF8_UNCRA|nr:MAG: hypothetical protein A2268_04260 [Candidatus Raymondbacteria bacterium RifOxyA12_full_50_37]OGJ92275.1 MAG: hypothetical protein A2350_14815 [Candidatus Raymondbacteria bacterium RifOxyB12_full_50_8]OGJ92563.1 MAG: hypothetical protein A2248_05690 [Candidatus Raymondbacteria bacterium RIFOXYA2_FULL_49_16]OGJ97917.1 MAG: hypothetical protein A2453_02715 [Candidatus Raymondbacteria bacterium RIFOXYC2_FULL_50_21]OGK03968.1 MAG: hypothetical protein A2519_04570 [Candidatus Raymondbacteria b